MKITKFIIPLLCLFVAVSVNAERPKKYQDRKDLVVSTLELNNQQKMALKEQRAEVVEKRKACSKNTDAAQKKACMMEVNKDNRKQFMATLSKEQREKFRGLQKEKKIFLP